MKKITAGLIATIAIVASVIFAGCVEEKISAAKEKCFSIDADTVPVESGIGLLEDMDLD